MENDFVEGRVDNLPVFHSSAISVYLEKAKHDLSLSYFQNESNPDVDHFIKYYKNNMSEELCKILADQIMEQNKTPLWYELGYAWGISMKKLIDGALFEQVVPVAMFCNKNKGLFGVAAPDFEMSKYVIILEVPYDEMFIKDSWKAANFFNNAF